MRNSWRAPHYRHSVATFVLVAVATVAPNANVVGAQTILTPPPNRGTVTLFTPGLPPRNLTVVGTPAYANVTWGDPGRGLRTPPVYSVQRWLESDLTCCNAQVNGLTALRWGDESVPRAGAYIYRVTVFQSDGTVGSADVRWVRPNPVNPTNFAGSLDPNGVVTLRWDAVAEVSWYQLTGPGIPNGTFASLNTFFLVRSLPSGAHTWNIGSVYSSPNAPAPVSGSPSTFPRVTVVVPE